jgi:hypothetical protein
MKSLLATKKYPSSLIEFAEECKKIIHGSFQYFAADDSTIELDATGIKQAIKNEDEDKIFSYSEAALIKCQSKIEAALNELFEPPTSDLINSSQVFALLSMFLTISLRAQDIDKLREDIAESDIQAQTKQEAYHALVLGVLDTIYSLAMPKIEETSDTEIKIERVFN